jgi:hypothetical protein
LKLVLLGNPDPGSWKWDVAEAAEALGWDTVHLAARDIPTRTVENAADGADLLIWARTHKHNPLGDASQMITRIAKNGTKTVGIHLDLYWGHPKREPSIGADAWWLCQSTWTADGGNRPWWTRGVRHHWLQPAAGLRWLQPCTPKTFDLDACFVGGVASVHEGRQALIDWARSHWGPRFTHYGQPGNKITGHDLCGLYASTISIGDSAPTDNYWSDRVPLTLARQGLLTHPETKGLDEAFDGAVITYPRGDHQALADKLHALTEADMADLRQRGLDVVKERHLWTHRLTQIAEKTL